MTLAVVINGCCTEKYCLGIDDLDTIQFEGLEVTTETDTILIERYTRGTGFLVALDEVEVPFMSGLNDATVRNITLPEKIDPGFDYQVVLKGAGKSWRLSEFTSKKRSCNSGVLCADSYNSLESYRVNHQVNTGDWQIVLKLATAEDYLL